MVVEEEVRGFKAQEGTEAPLVAVKMGGTHVHGLERDSSLTAAEEMWISVLYSQGAKFCQ